MLRLHKKKNGGQFFLYFSKWSKYGVLPGIRLGSAYPLLERAAGFFIMEVFTSNMGLLFK